MLRLDQLPFSLECGQIKFSKNYCKILMLSMRSYKMALSSCESVRVVEVHVIALQLDKVQNFTPMSYAAN